jgi:hypothetical protein
MLIKIVKCIGIHINYLANLWMINISWYLFAHKCKDTIQVKRSNIFYSIMSKIVWTRVLSISPTTYLISNINNSYIIRVITKFSNTEQSCKGKGKTRKLTNRQNQSITGKLGSLLCWNLNFRPNDHSDSAHHFFGNACTKSEPLRFSQFSGYWLILSVC